MAENSKISWTDHTFNIAWGCEEVSPACDNCYAREFSKSVGFAMADDAYVGDPKDRKMVSRLWATAERRTFGEKHWNEPLKWNQRASSNGLTEYVFCSSMCDIFEVHPVIKEELKKLAPLIERTPSLTWLLLTKRFLEVKRHPELTSLRNVMMGVTVENENYLPRITSNISWVSAEPLFGHMNIRPFLKMGVKWVIIGGESGAKAREMPLDAALDLIEQCKEAGVAVHFKQTGDVLARKLGLKDKSGKDPSEWPEKLRIQQFPAKRWEPMHAD